ncbi:hypothetical protein Mapa_004787 [Marchantia paleacea]|nr:hypothetical protein Mapa_004787 [Marchantia paleacea]
MFTIENVTETEMGLETADFTHLQLRQRLRNYSGYTSVLTDSTFPTYELFTLRQVSHMGKKYVAILAYLVVMQDTVISRYQTLSFTLARQYLYKFRVVHIMVSDAGQQDTS